MESAETKKKVTLTIDGKTFVAPEGTTILNAAKLVGITIPHFCYHRKLSIAGNCRICAVEAEGMSDPVISCRETVKDDMVVHTNSQMAVEARTSVLEFILINHPLDCPVCDCAGECKLQDYYFEHSLVPSRFAESKTRKPKVVDAGSHIVLDAERCISCARCIRFCEEIVGKHEIGFMERSDHQEITSHRTLTNKYSLCTVDLCPVGALTSKDFRFKKRVWFLTNSPGVCTGCATGCNTWVDFEGDTIYRMRPRDNESVNGPWMCDDGRMTYKRLIGEDRALKPLINEGGQRRETSWDEALARITHALADIPRNKIAGILSAQATVEENAAFHELFTKTLGINNVFMSGREPDPNFADDFLRDADQNPNTAGAEQFTKERLGENPNFDAYIILGGVNETEREHIISSKPRFIMIASTHVVEWADVVLPLAPVEEQDGTLINRQNIEQQTQAAYPAKGEAMSGCNIAEKIAHAF